MSDISRIHVPETSDIARALNTLARTVQEQLKALQTGQTLLTNRTVTLETRTAIDGSGLYVLKAGDTMDGNLDLNGNTLQNETTLQSHDSQLSVHDTEISTHDSRLDGHDTDIHSAEGRLDVHDTDIHAAEGRLDGHDTDIHTLEVEKYPWAAVANVVDNGNWPGGGLGFSELCETDFFIGSGERIGVHIWLELIPGTTAIDAAGLKLVLTDTDSGGGGQETHNIWASGLLQDGSRPNIATSNNSVFYLTRVISPGSVKNWNWSLQGESATTGANFTYNVNMILHRL